MIVVAVRSDDDEIGAAFPGCYCYACCRIFAHCDVLVDEDAIGVVSDGEFVREFGGACGCIAFVDADHDRIDSAPDS
jgi:hypothetical protein